MFLRLSILILMMGELYAKGEPSTAESPTLVLGMVSPNIVNTGGNNAVNILHELRAAPVSQTITNRLKIPVAALRPGRLDVFIAFVPLVGGNVGVSVREKELSSQKAQSLLTAVGRYALLRAEGVSRELATRLLSGKPTLARYDALEKRILSQNQEFNGIEFTRRLSPRVRARLKRLNLHLPADVRFVKDKQGLLIFTDLTQGPPVVEPRRLSLP